MLNGGSRSCVAPCPNVMLSSPSAHIHILSRSMLLPCAPIIICMLYSPDKSCKAKHKKANDIKLGLATIKLGLATQTFFSIGFTAYEVESVHPSLMPPFIGEGSHFLLNCSGEILWDRRQFSLKCLIVPRYTQPLKSLCSLCETPPSDTLPLT